MQPCHNSCVCVEAGGLDASFTFTGEPAMDTGDHGAHTAVAAHASRWGTFATRGGESTLRAEKRRYLFFPPLASRHSRRVPVCPITGLNRSLCFQRGSASDLSSLWPTVDGRRVATGASTDTRGQSRPHPCDFPRTRIAESAIEPSR